MTAARKLTSAAMLTAALLCSQFTHATPMGNGNGNGGNGGNGGGGGNQVTPPSCNVADIQITSIQKQDGSAAQSVPAIDATACYGAFSGNDDVSALGNNLGYDNVGWLNQESEYWPGQPGAFISNADLQNLQGLGNIDPGWIFFGKYTAGNFAPSSSSKDGFGTYNYAADLVSLTNCKDKNGGSVACTGGSVVSGEWTYKPPVNNPQQLLDMLGTDKYFDQVTVVFKSGNMFALYNFNISALNLPPVLGTNDENYLFKGVWNMAGTLLNASGGAGLSHVSIWGRDPVSDTPPPPPVDVPVSAPLTLAGLGLLLLGLHRRRQQA
ncbi:hypothetical protein [Rheinheimera tilapiae]|uniref:PEP-CTERM sorting domain-containing protein n=1 Tax=Rheinheimera tilapiae TaxID=875043 RepID=A0ABV6BAM9_9GAMM